MTHQHVTASGWREVVEGGLVVGTGHPIVLERNATPSQRSKDVPLDFGARTFRHLHTKHAGDEMRLVCMLWVCIFVGFARDKVQSFGF